MLRLKSHIQNVVLVVIPLLLLILLFEMILRFGVIQNPYHTRLEWELNPKDASDRILIVGDSFSEKNGELNQMLTKEFSTKHVQLLNISQGGLGPVEYYQDIKRWIKNIKPKTIILSYYVGNDLTNAQKTSKRIDEFLDQFYLTEFINSRKFSKDQFPTEKWKGMGIDSEMIEWALQEKINPWLLEAARHDQNYILNNILMEGRENQALWEKVQSLLKKIIDEAKLYDAELSMVIFPRSVQINKDLFPFFEKVKLNLDEKTLHSRKPQDLLLEFCKTHAVRCLDLLPAFRAKNDESLYKERDDHLNTNGNRLAAKLIIEFYNQKNMRIRPVGSVIPARGARRHTKKMPYWHR